jgi:hypothetical protein
MAKPSKGTRRDRRLKANAHLKPRKGSKRRGY